MLNRRMPARISSRGRDIAAAGNVSIQEFDSIFNVFRAEVQGTELYDVMVSAVDPELDVCDCPYFSEKYYCKHIAAVVTVINQNPNYLKLAEEAKLAELEIAKIENYEPSALFQQPNSKSSSPVVLNSTARRFISQLDLPNPNYFQPLKEIDSQFLRVVYELRLKEKTHSYYEDEYSFDLRLRIGVEGQDKSYQIPDIHSFFKSYQNNEVYQTRGKARYLMAPEFFSEDDQKLLDVLIDLAAHDSTPTDYYYSSNNNKGIISFDFKELRAFIQAFQETEWTKLDYFCNQKTYQTIEARQFSPEDSMFKAIVTEMGESLSLHIVSDFYLMIDSMAGAIIIRDNIIYFVTNVQLELIGKIVNVYNQNKSKKDGILFSRTEDRLLQQFLQHFEQIGTVELPEEFEFFDMTPDFALDVQNHTLQLKLGYHYQDKLIASEDKNQLQQVTSRIVEKEQQAQLYVESLGFEYQKGLWEKEFQDASEIYRFFTYEKPNLEKNGQLHLTEELKSKLQEKPELQSNVVVSERHGILSMSFSIEGIDEDEIEYFLKKIDISRPYLEQPDGTLLLLNEDLRKLAISLQKLRQQAKIKRNQLEMSASQALNVKRILKDATFEEEFKQLIQHLAHPESFEYAEYQDIQAELRPYQKSGIQWLEMLHHYHFGGILADEMGLGKTLQLITFLSNHVEKEPHLVVAPTSLIYNWQQECLKFVPHLSVEVIEGTKAKRMKTIRESKADILITSYNSFRLDNREYEAKSLNYLVLDEAQAIKNSQTKTNQSLREIQPKGVFALSGTPIENRVEELWAIFEIVLPGLLPKKAEFSKLTPTEIALRVKPFILRREKKDVLTEIPDKVEMNLYNELTAQQKNVYLAQLKQMQVQVKGLTKDSFVKNKLEILAGLTRLRQICDTPALYIDDYEGGSGKLEQLQEILSQAQENHRHVLIFSQFTSMLDEIGQMLNRNQMSYLLLKGDTKPKERIKLVNQFNQGEKNIFLISLKAGGTGLNLTTADMVILVDLWWNPAVEDQATARAHRLGQKKTVDVIRLITKGTIEEKIDKLQKSKRNLVDQILIGTDQKSTLTEEEIRLILGIS
ncbi:DEAD/DEAH box helicase [Enterococcus camelliae]|uniref:SNF2-related protein n=1 Tax=Enterococcus camelliae TaxID=453959 RepID=A0ABW5TK88_9ENTE